MWFVYDWLPRVFILDVLLFHLVADDPLAARCWRRPPWRRGAPSASAVRDGT